jgi:carboxyl-terminal processing protease
MDPNEFTAYLNREKGIYEGIGVDLVLQQHGSKPTTTQLQPPPQDAQDAVATMSRFPSVVVSAVVPGGPADKAGVKVGDVVADIDGHWVVEDTLLEKFKKARDLFNTNKLTYSQIAPLQKELRDKTERALLPARTFPRLLLGKSGSVNVTWTRNGVSRTTNIEKAVSAMPGFSSTGGTIVLPMSESGAKGLQTAISGKKAVSIDLRYDPEGSFPAMLQCLQVLAPPGHYGEIVNQRSEGPTIVLVPTGNPKPPKITLLVGPATRGPAAIFALALSRYRYATLDGRLPTGNVTVKQDVELPQGYGYDLAIGEYRTGNTASGGVMASKTFPKGILAKANSSVSSRENRTTVADGGTK